MVGGGPGAFIGAVHRMAAALDGEYQLVAGAFASRAEGSREQGRALGLDTRRVYGSFREMAEAEAALDPDHRIDAVSIVTPNHLHHAVAKAFLAAGIHVVCDKPMTTTVADAEDLCTAAEGSGLVFALTHNYTGYPMVKEARHLVRSGRLGALRKVVAEYPQGWLGTRLEETGHKQAAWRQDPAQAGSSSAVGDIGSHLDNLVRYVTGLEIEAVFAELATLVPGRALEDDAGILVRFQGGAPGVYYASQVSAGEENGLTLPGLRRVRRAGLAPGATEPPRCPARRRAPPADDPRQRLSVRRGPPRDAPAAGAPGGVHRGVREYLSECREGDRGGDCGSGGRPPRPGLPGPRRRPPGHALHRGSARLGRAGGVG